MKGALTRSLRDCSNEDRKSRSVVLRLPNVQDITDGTQDDVIVCITTDTGISDIGEVDAPPRIITFYSGGMDWNMILTSIPCRFLTAAMIQ